jgi:hypothetical protein
MLPPQRLQSRGDKPASLVRTGIGGASRHGARSTPPLMPWREFLGPSFMQDLARLARAGGAPVRTVFWFDG